MEFAVEEINSRRDLLPNVTLGFDLRDDCYSDELSLWQGLTLVSPGSPGAFKGLCSMNAPRVSQLVGLVGTGFSQTSIQASRLGQLFDVPVVSYGAHSDEFSDREMYANFLMTSTPDRLRVEAILDILEHFGWDYVALLYSTDSDGLHGAMQFEAMAGKRNVCLAMSSHVRFSMSKEHHDDIVAKILASDKATVIVTFLSRTDALTVLQTFKESGLTHRYIWLTAKVWENVLNKKDLGDVISGGIILKATQEPVPEFDRYVTSVSEKPWDDLSEWLQEALCIHQDYTNCTKIRKLFQRAEKRGAETPTVNAVRALAQALHAYIQEDCAGTPDCISKEGITRSRLLSHLKNVTFPAPGGNFSFNDYGDGGGAYTIYNFYEVDGKYSMVEVGRWSSPTHVLLLNETQMRWQNGSKEIPRSSCREDCRAGSYPVPMGRCCNGCQSCRKSTIVNGSRCVRCGPTEWPDSSRTRCRPIAPTPLDYSHHVVILLLALSGLGAALCCLTTALGVAFRCHALVKASSRELSGVNVLGLTLAFVTGGLALLPPGPAACIAAEVGFAFSLTLNFSTTLLKVVRIYRIFKAGQRSVKRPRFVSPKAQIVMVTIIVLIQGLIATVSMSVSPTKPQTLSRVITGSVNEVEIYCQFGADFYATGLYNPLLILACCYYAIKARKVPSNYNESKFIAVSVYSTLVLCLAAVPVYTTAVAVLQKVATLCLALLLNAYLTLVCVYLPKLYAILFVKEGGLALAAWNTPCSQAPAASLHRDARLLDTSKVHPLPSSDSTALPSVSHSCN
ncbi:metabotropic glutamate receptor 3-like [Acanthaster planci]|uniref:Metabotropic glutamate receptor 3-like n=1 Tax=Acanthaster planci TaxID=133434 RepID=A0A8B7Y2N7_ACAPL|nr:metabotropic glutamate receptor 3-like [Acanthaster planci]